MNTLQTAIKFFQDCGPFLYPSLLLMALGLAIAAERLLFLHRARQERLEAERGHALDQIGEKGTLPLGPEGSDEEVSFPIAGKPLYCN